MQKIRIGVEVRGVLFGSFLDKQKGTLTKYKTTKAKSAANIRKVNYE